MKYRAIVMGVSSGGLNAMKMILPELLADFGIPIIIVQHVSPRSDGQWIEMFNSACNLNLKEADDKEEIKKGNIYLAPPNYHLLVERDATFSLSVDSRVNYARPSIDVLFESAAEAYKKELIGVILTGSNSDGALGLKKIKDRGGLAIVQDPITAEASSMPESAIASVLPDYILPLEDIAALLTKLNESV